MKWNLTLCGRLLLAQPIKSICCQPLPCSESVFCREILRCFLLLSPQSALGSKHPLFRRVLTLCLPLCCVSSLPHFISQSITFLYFTCVNPNQRVLVNWSPLETSTRSSRLSLCMIYPLIVSDHLDNFHLNPEHFSI